LLMQACGRRPPILCDEERIRPAGSEVNRLLAGNARIRRLTGWRPQTPFAEGLAHTVAWIRDNLSHFSGGGYNV
jgi:nucleoside-diphosphate-sugar epimerase